MPTKARGARDTRVTNDRISFAQDVMSMIPAALSRKLAELETTMAEHAKNLEFEEAAAVRDQIASSTNRIRWRVVRCPRAVASVRKIK